MKSRMLRDLVHLTCFWGWPFAPRPTQNIRPVRRTFPSCRTCSELSSSLPGTLLYCLRFHVCQHQRLIGVLTYFVLSIPFGRVRPLAGVQHFLDADLLGHFLICSTRKVFRYPRLVMATCSHWRKYKNVWMYSKFPCPWEEQQGRRSRMFNLPAHLLLDVLAEIFVWFCPLQKKLEIFRVPPMVGHWKSHCSHLKQQQLVWTCSKSFHHRKEQAARRSRIFRLPAHLPLAVLAKMALWFCPLQKKFEIGRVSPLAGHWKDRISSVSFLMRPNLKVLRYPRMVLANCSHSKMQKLVWTCSGFPCHCEKQPAMKSRMLRDLVHLTCFWGWPFAPRPTQNIRPVRRTFPSCRTCSELSSSLPGTLLYCLRFHVCQHQRLIGVLTYFVLSIPFGRVRPLAGVQHFLDADLLGHFLICSTRKVFRYPRLVMATCSHWKKYKHVWMYSKFPCPWESNVWRSTSSHIFHRTPPFFFRRIEGSRIPPSEPLPLC